MATIEIEFHLQPHVLSKCRTLHAIARQNSPTRHIARDFVGGEGGIRSRGSRYHQRFRRDSKPSIHHIHSKPEYQVQNRDSEKRVTRPPVYPTAAARLRLPRGPMASRRRQAPEAVPDLYRTAR